MLQIEERILEQLNDEGWSTPKTIASNHRLHELNADALVVERRLNVLVARELAAPEAGGYEITTWGQAYLRGDLDAGYLPRHPRTQ
ncbi:MAG: hypothetical protein ABEH78_08015 [Haloferacaceae archaeon]